MKLETGCRSTKRLLTELILSLDPSVSEKTRRFTVKEYSPGMNRTSVRDAQAACGFNCSASKCAPFFQRVNVMAAIFRANVRRAMAGSIPWLTKP